MNMTLVSFLQRKYFIYDIIPSLQVKMIDFCHCHNTYEVDARMVQGIGFVLQYLRNIVI